MQTKHEFDFKNAKILHNERNTNKRRIKESIYITKNLKNSVNNHTDVDNMNTFYASSIEKIKI